MPQERRHQIDATPLRMRRAARCRRALHADLLQRVQSWSLHSRDRLSDRAELQLTIQSVPPPADAAKYRKPDHDLDTIR